MIKRLERRSIAAMIADERAKYFEAREQADSEQAWRALERVHILSQPFLVAHTSSHWLMLRYALYLRDRREIIGQVFRLILAPLGAIAGRIPIGNTGRANVSAFKPMPVPDDLKVDSSSLR